MPGLRGRPAVITTTSELAVFLIAAAVCSSSLRQLPLFQNFQLTVD